nr:Abi family protein [uncultured Comamonas sp.]
MAFLFWVMATLPSFKSYAKLPLAVPDVLTKLRAQGLIIGDAQKASDVLSRVNYFRIRGYLYPYLDLANVPAAPAPKNFKAGATFEQALQMYRFDEGLKKLIFNLMPDIEVALRTVLDATMCKAAGHGFWYLEKKWFKGKHPSKIIDSLSSSFCNSSENYAQHFQQTYFNNISGIYKHLPPFWVLFELSTIGQLHEFYVNIDENAPSFPATSLPCNTVLDKMAKNRMGADQYKDLRTWVKMLRAIRNICAHHGRLWNKNVLAPQGITNKVSIPFPMVHTGSTTPKTNTVYASLIVLRLMSKKLGIDDGIKDGLLALLATHPEANLPPQLFAMGIPPNWHQDSVWL